MITHLLNNKGEQTYIIILWSCLLILTRRVFRTPRWTRNGRALILVHSCNLCNACTLLTTCNPKPNDVWSFLKNHRAEPVGSPFNFASFCDSDPVSSAIISRLRVFIRLMQCSCAASLCAVSSKYPSGWNLQLQCPTMSWHYCRPRQIYHICIYMWQGEHIKLLLINRECDVSGRDVRYKK